jgi:hypothetical protein
MVCRSTPDASIGTTICSCLSGQTDIFIVTRPCCLFARLVFLTDLFSALFSFDSNTLVACSLDCEHWAYEHIWARLCPAHPSNLHTRGNIVQPADIKKFDQIDVARNEVLSQWRWHPIQQSFVPCSHPCVTVFQVKVSIHPDLGALAMPRKRISDVALLNCILQHIVQHVSKQTGLRKHRKY